MKHLHLVFLGEDSYARIHGYIKNGLFLQPKHHVVIHPYFGGLFPLPDQLQVALHEDVIETEDQAHQHEHLDHLNGGRHLQAVRYSQESKRNYFNIVQ